VFALSINLAIAGFMLLRNRGRPQGHFEYTTALVRRASTATSATRCTRRCSCWRPASR
jgi:hypothetical protein